MIRDANLSRIRLLFEKNPAYRNVYASTILFCAEPQRESDVLDHAESLLTATNQLQTAASVVASLVSQEALAETIFVDGDVYEGSFTDLQTDETVADDAMVDVQLKATPEGLEIAAQRDQAQDFARLVETHPERACAYIEVLRLAAQPDGITTRDLQDALKRADMLETDAERGVDNLHASYFTGALEAIGALQWNGHTWNTSRKGRDILQNQETIGHGTQEEERSSIHD